MAMGFLNGCIQIPSPVGKDTMPWDGVACSTKDCLILLLTGPKWFWIGKVKTHIPNIQCP
jgi:hypothetical protein